MPDFAALFPVCQCGADECEDCSGYQMTLRSAAILWAVAYLHADFAYDDVQHYRDAPVSEKDDGWAAFADYPADHLSSECGVAAPAPPGRTRSSGGRCQQVGWREQVRQLGGEEQDGQGR